MSIELVKALIQIVRACASSAGCEKCALREFCGKEPINW